MRLLLAGVATFLVSLTALSWHIAGTPIGSAYTDPVAQVRAQDESMYVNSTIRMTEDGDWLTPKLMGRLYLFKPPLLQWLAAIAVQTGGLGLGTVRLPSLVFGAAGVAIVFLWIGAKRSWPMAAAAALLLLSDPIWVTFSRLAFTDVLASTLALAAMFTLAFDGELRRRRSRILFGASAAAAVLAKSIVGVLPFVGLALFWVVIPGSKRPSIFRVAQTIAIFVLVAAPWHLYQLWAHPQWFWTEFVRFQLFAVGLTESTGVTGYPFFYLRRLLTMDPLLFVLAISAAYGIVRVFRRREPAEIAAICWCSAVVVALAVFRGRSVSYMVLLIPALCLVVGLLLPELGRDVAHALVWALSAISTNLAASRRKHLGSEVAHALVRAASALVPTPLGRESSECVRHQQSRPSSPEWREVCGARDVPAGDRPSLVPLPLPAENTEASPRAPDDPLGNVSAAPNLLPCPIGWPWILVAHALLRAASPLLATPPDSRQPEAATRVSLRHARVRAPLAWLATIARTAKGLWRQRRSQRDRPSLVPAPLNRANVECRPECVSHPNPPRSLHVEQQVWGANYRGNIAAYATLLLVMASFALKATVHHQPWSLVYNTPPIDSVAGLRAYYLQNRAADLVIAAPDDAFYATILPGLRVRYCFLDPTNAVGNSLPHYIDLGIAVTPAQLANLNTLSPGFLAKLSEWHVHSAEPIASAILLRSRDELNDVARALPNADFNVPADWQPIAPETFKDTHVLECSGARCFALTRTAGRNTAPRTLPPGW